MHSPDQTTFPLRRITATGEHFFFGYYDKWQFDPTDRYVLGMCASFMNRPPEPDDQLAVGMIDTMDNDRWIELGATASWCFQQGCMLQWMPGSDSQVIYNVRGERAYEAEIVDVATGNRRRLPHAIYTVHPTGTEAIGNDFARVADLRPGYGYVGFDDPNEQIDAPEDAGLRRISLTDGNSELIISIAQMAKVDRPRNTTTGRHWLNHILYNTNGSRIVFLHRWQVNGGFLGRMYTCNPDGSDLRRLADGADPASMNPSHFWWRDAQTIIAWGVMPGTPNDGAYVLIDDVTAKRTELSRIRLHCDGHMSYCPDGSGWILSDTYPDESNQRELFLYHPDRDLRVTLGRFDAGDLWNYGRNQECRCDLHPRWNRAGTRVCIDSVHEGFRGMYLIDVTETKSKTKGV